MSKTVFVSGCAGFIGFHLSKFLLEREFAVIGLDNINDYYDIRLKLDRLDILRTYPNFVFHKASLEDRETINSIFQNSSIDYVVNLAAQAGVRYSLENPHAYISSNINGFMNILEACRHFGVAHLVYASSSSVYGSNKTIPFSTDQNVDNPISIYAATKKSNELMAHAYSHLFGIPTTGLRFFTVYGPFGRPDMALFLFTKAILQGRPIDVYNYGKMKRDFTYVDDIVQGIYNTMMRIPAKTPLENDSGFAPPYRIYNIGNHSPVELEYLIDLIEKNTGKKAIKNYLPLQAGDVVETYADIDALIRDTGFTPSTSIETGVERFIQWYQEYYRE